MCGLLSSLSSCSTHDNWEELPAAAVIGSFGYMSSGSDFTMVCNWALVAGSSLVIVPSIIGISGSGVDHFFICRKIPNPMYTRWISQRSINSWWCSGTAFSVHQILSFFKWINVWFPVIMLKKYMHMMSPRLFDFTAFSQSSMVNFFVCKYSDTFSSSSSW